MASIRKHRNKYQVQIRRLGYAPISKSFTRLKDAKEWARHVEVQADRDELPQDRKLLETLTLGELVGRYRDEVTPRKRSHATETIVLNAFLRHPLCHKTLATLTSKDFVQYRDERLANVKPSTLRRQFNPLQHMFDVAREEWGIPLQTNPIAKVKLTGVDTPRERRLRTGEEERLLAAARTRKNPWIAPVVVFALQTAMRRGEILNLRWDQVDLERRSVTILESKNGHCRTIPLTPEAVALLQSIEGGNGEVFPVTVETLKMAWRRMVDQAGIEDLRFHDLRHEAISRFFEMGLTMPEVALISGHRNLKMLSRYSHADGIKIIGRFYQKASARSDLHQEP